MALSCLTNFNRSEFHLSLALFVLATVIGQAQERPGLLDVKTGNLLHEELSGELAKDHVIAITRHHRIQGSRGYRAAAQYVLGELRKCGFDEKQATIESFRSDGRVNYQTWQSPSGWDIESAELRIVEPFDERIVSFPEIAMSVMTYSNPGEVRSELVWVGEGTKEEDYKDKAVSGKIVLATGYGGDVHRLAVLKHKARAVICYLDDERAKQYPDMLAYTGLWPRTEELADVTFGFNLTRRQGERLRTLLTSGKKVVVDARVSGTGLEPYFMDVVVARILGSERPEEELVFSAHLDHPKESANDNASGSAAILDMARTFKSLVQWGKLPRPKRTLRFIWVPEWYGTMAYIDAHPELKGPDLGGKILANLNLDMVGENLELLHSVFMITRTPDSIPSAVNDLVEEMAALVDQMEIRTPRGSLSVANHRITPYAGGSDHMMFIDRKIPGMMFVHTDYTHHTSEDTPDKVDPVELERCELVAAGAFWYLANLSAEQAKDWLSWTGASAMHRLGLEGLRSQRLLKATDTANVATAWAEAQNLLDHAVRREQRVVDSILNFNRDDQVSRAVQSYHEHFKTQLAFLSQQLAAFARGMGASSMSPLNTKVDSRVPLRLTRGPLDFSLPAKRLSKEKADWYRSSTFPLVGDMTFELVNFIDGQRSVSELRNAVSAEFTPVPLEAIGRYLDDLVEVGALKWRQP